MKPIVIDSEGNPARICSFCQRAGDPSKEHLLASRWSDYFPEWKSHDVHDVGWLVDVDGQLTTRNRVRRRQGAFTQTAPRGVVCNGCNNGWMNRLEEKAIPILLPMVRGESPPLSAYEVQVVEHWAAKTAVVAELMDEGGKAVDFFLTGALKDLVPGSSSPPSFFTVVKPVEPCEGSHIRSTIFSLRYADHECTGHFIRAATILVGAVALVIVYSADPTAFEAMIDSEPWRYLGEPAWNGRNGWSLDRSAVLKVEQVLGLNDVIGEALRRVAAGDPAAPKDFT